MARKSISLDEIIAFLKTDGTEEDIDG